jgi:hypothetical protein
MTISPSDPDPILDGERPHAAAAVTLQLSWLRAAYMVGRALWAAFPTSDAWEAALKDRTFLEEIAAFSVVIDDIRRSAKISNELDFDELQTAFAQQRDRALDALRLTAARLDVDIEDLLAVLLHA